VLNGKDGFWKSLSQISNEKVLTKEGNTMKKILLVGLILIAGCTGGNYSSSSSKEEGGQFNPDTCANVPLSVEEYQKLGLGPKGEKQIIKCSDLERCASLSGQTPPDIPCE
jgi:hypothetical protein